MNPSPALTPRQREYWLFMLDYQRRCSGPPSVREIQAKFNLRSESGAYTMIQRLVARGYVERRSGYHRSYVAIEPKQSDLKPALIRVLEYPRLSQRTRSELRGLVAMIPENNNA